MLDKYNYIPTNVNGRHIAHARRTPIERALLGADLHLDRIRLIRPTMKQSAELVGVCSPYLAAAVKIANDPDARAAVLAGRVPLVIAGWSLASDSLADHLLRSSQREKASLSETVGVEYIWDELVAPHV